MLLSALALQTERDPLTGLANRHGFEQSIERARAEAREGYGVVYLDVDHFKAINDTYGHAAGDDLLVQIGNRLRAAARRDDIVARVGGDEFVVIGSNTDYAGAALTCERITRSLSAEPFKVALAQVSVQVSSGFAYHQGVAPDLAEMLGAADRQMYQAKSLAHAGGQPVRLQT